MAKSKTRKKKKQKQIFTKRKNINFLHSGSLGDIVYSLPFIISKGGGNIYIKDHNSHSVMKGQFELMRRFLESQPYIKQVLEYPINYANKHSDIMGGKIESVDRLLEMRGLPISYHPDIKIDYDLDFFRLSPFVFKEHLITSYYTYFESNPELKLPFISIKGSCIHAKSDYILFSLTQRYRTNYDWSEVLEKTKDKKRFFVGLEDDYNLFISKYNCEMDFLQSKDIYELAVLIKDCKEIYCNTSVSLAIAVGLNKKYNLELHHNYVATTIPNENILNTELGLINFENTKKIEDLKILICVPVYNRKKITELALKSIYKNKKDATVWVYNDWSTEYDNDFLEPYADKVFKLEKSKKIVVQNENNIFGMGVQHLRWHQLRSFIEQDEFDAIYLTDSDAFHDPGYIDVLKTLYSQVSDKKGKKLPISLYNSVFHTLSTLENNGGIMLRKTAPGISQMYDKEMCKIIVKELNSLDSDPEGGVYDWWDYRCIEYLKRPIITTKNSYIEHYGAVEGSLHTNRGDWDKDRAVNPTEGLKKDRDKIILY